MKRFSCLLPVLACVAMVGGNAFAQVPAGPWVLEVAHAERALSQAGTYTNQEAAEAALREVPGPSDAVGAFQYVKSQRTFPVDGVNTAIVFTLGAEQPLDPDWTYSYITGRHATEALMLESMAASYEGLHEASCGALQIDPLEDWAPTSPDTEGRQESRLYGVTVQLLLSGGGCAPYTMGGYATRSRRLQCPVPYTAWEDASQACVRPDVVAYLTGPLQPDECEVGNPCDVQTGDKSQPETDFDLGWVSFVRTFRSSQVARQSHFGPGWSHSHDVHFGMSGDHGLLNEGSGLQRPFRRVGSAYFAADASGDRIEADAAGGWTLFNSDRTVTFDADGRIARATRQDGSFVVYRYDATGRLAGITHSSGRELTFSYLGNTRHAAMGGIKLNGEWLVRYYYNYDGYYDDQVAYVAFPGGSRREYHYEDERFPYFLTGISDEMRDRYSWFEYDSSGRVTASYHDGGADRVSLTYGPQKTVVIDALGARTTYDLTPPGAGSPKVAMVTDAGGTMTRSHLDASVDFRRRPDTFADRAGTQTRHAYSEELDPVTGQRISIHTVTEAFGLESQRISEERRDVASNRLLSITREDRQVRYSYNSRLQPLTMTVEDLAGGQLRTTIFSYCEAADVAVPGSTCPILGLPRTVNGPRTDVADTVTYSYYPSDEASCASSPSTCGYRKGDLWKTTNALGHVTEVLSYDNAGRPLSVKGADGVVSDYAYHPRGWLASGSKGAMTASPPMIASLRSTTGPRGW